MTPGATPGTNPVTGKTHFTHAKVAVRCALLGVNLPASGMDVVDPFFRAIESRESRDLYELYRAAQIQEVGAAIVTYKRRPNYESALLTVSVWVYGASLVPGILGAPILLAVSNAFKSGKLFGASGAECREWKVESIAGPRGKGAPEVAPIDFRMGVHADKRKHRRSDPSAPGKVGEIRGFAVSDLLALP